MARVGFPFVPTPQAAKRAMAIGVIDRDDVAILVFLWGESVVQSLLGARKATATLEEIAKGVRWKKPADTLYRRLVRLRRGGWITFETRPGRGAPYTFTLDPAPDRSEIPATENGSGVPRYGEEQDGIVPAVAAREPDDCSEIPAPSNGASVPRSPAPGPSFEDAATPLPDSDCGEATNGSVPSSLRRTFCSEDYEEVVGERTPGLSGDRYDSAQERLVEVKAEGTGPPWA